MVYGFYMDYVWISHRGDRFFSFFFGQVKTPHTSYAQDARELSGAGSVLRFLSAVSWFFLNFGDLYWSFSVFSWLCSSDPIGSWGIPEVSFEETMQAGSQRLLSKLQSSFKVEKYHEPKGIEWPRSWAKVEGGKKSIHMQQAWAMKNKYKHIKTVMFDI